MRLRLLRNLLDFLLCGSAKVGRACVSDIHAEECTYKGDFQSAKDGQAITFIASQLSVVMVHCARNESGTAQLTLPCCTAV